MLNWIPPIWSAPTLLSIAKKVLNDIESGQVIYIITTDEGSFQNLPSYCHQHGHEVLEDYKEEGVFQFFIKKG